MRHEQPMFILKTISWLIIFLFQDQQTYQTIEMSSFLDLPNEIILKVLSYSEITDILRCGQASKRIRTISNDKSLFHIVNLSGKYVTIAFIKTVLNKGCRSLKLSDAYIFGYFLGLNQNLQLRELDFTVI